MKHTCHAIGCRIEIPPKLFMCPEHWYKIPQDLRDQVWHHYKPGQEIKKNPSSSYLSVAKAAIVAVREIERQGHAGL